MLKKSYQKIPFFCFILFIFINVSSISVAVQLTHDQMVRLGMLAIRDGEYERADQVFQKVVGENPRFASVYNGLGLLHQSWDQGSVNEALRYYRMAVDIDPNYLECWNSLGRIYYARGHFASAKEAFLKSLGIKSDQPDINLMMAWVYLFGESEPEKAAPYFEGGLATHDPMAHYGLGMCYLFLGEKFKVLDHITALRHLGKEDHALKLEGMMRADVKLNSLAGKPLVTGKEPYESAFERALSQMGEGAVDADKKDQGIQVRLKGVLP